MDKLGKALMAMLEGPSGTPSAALVFVLVLWLLLVLALTCTHRTIILEEIQMTIVELADLLDAHIRQGRIEGKVILPGVHLDEKDVPEWLQRPGRSKPHKKEEDTMKD
jgi:hypothetical protein